MSCKIFNLGDTVVSKNTNLFLGENSCNRNIQTFHDPKYPWIMDYAEEMRTIGNWSKFEIDLSNEKRDFDSLDEAGQHIYEAGLKFAITLDSCAGRAPLQLFNNGGISNNPEWELYITNHQNNELLHCCVEGTEVLTAEGFKDFRDVDNDTKVANYEEDGSITFTPPLDIIQSEYSGDMYTFEQGHYLQQVTPNHRILYFDRYNDDALRVEFAEDTSVTNHKLPVSGYKVGSTHYLTPNEKMAIAYQADGTLVNGGNITKDGTCIRFHFKKSRKKEQLRELLHGFRHTVNENNTKEGYTDFYVWIDFDIDKTFEWVNLEHVSHRWCSEFLDNLVLWDGCVRKEGTKVYNNTNVDAVNKVHAIIVLCGKRSTIYKSKTTGFNGEDLGERSKDYYQVSIVDRDYVTGRTVQKTKAHYEGNIYCVTVPSSYIITRLNGKVAVTGNSESYTEMVRAIYNDVDVFIDNIIHDEQVQKRATSILASFDSATAVFDKMDANKTCTDNGLDKPFPEITETDVKKAIYKSAIVLNMFEGIRFFSTFVTNWSFSEQPTKLFPGSSNIFKLIARDEMIHLNIFQKIIKMLREDKSEGFVEIAKEMDEEVYDLFRTAYNEEMAWIEYLFSKGCPLIGMNETILKDYMTYIFAVRMINIGLDHTKLGIVFGSNPVPWIDNYLDSSHVKSAPQEIESVNYVAAIDSSKDEDFDLDDL
ncbi:MAG: hypothetical protein HOK52_13380 [Candidatus Marinimicrobia bacterium]|jgi:ribonucleotide reductase beta subunit family protein with ferritin-like domain|nr:hypothetical protein [Candidatus Neomarinimicrobiota bacterium]